MGGCVGGIMRVKLMEREFGREEGREGGKGREGKGKEMYTKGVEGREMKTERDELYTCTYM